MIKRFSTTFEKSVQDWKRDDPETLNDYLNATMEFVHKIERLSWDPSGNGKPRFRSVKKYFQEGTPENKELLSAIKQAHRLAVAVYAPNDRKSLIVDMSFFRKGEKANFTNIRVTMRMWQFELFIGLKR